MRIILLCRKYVFTTQILNDKDTEYLLAQFTNGELIHEIVSGY